MRALKVIAWVAGALIVLPLAALALVWALANTDPGRRLIERATAHFTRGDVVISGLSGTFPQRLRLSRIELRDAAGVWAAIDDVALDWTPSRLLRGVGQVDRLHIGRVQVARSPASTGPSSKGRSVANWPVRVEVGSLEVLRCDLAAAFAGISAAVEIRGSLHASSFEQASADLTIARLDGPGNYTLHGTIDGSRISADVRLEEPEHGLLANLIGLPDLGAVSLRGDMDGPTNAAAVQLVATAGAMHMSASGTVNLLDTAADLEVAATAPAMAPSADISWRSVAIQGRVHGPLATPNILAHARIEGWHAFGLGSETLDVDVGGDPGTVTLHTVTRDLRLPGPKPDLMVGAPLQVDAEIKLNEKGVPVTFAISHQLLSARGRVRTQNPIDGQANVTLPVLAPLAAIAGVDEQGHAAIDIRMTAQGSATRFDIDGTLGLTGGTAPLPQLIGDRGHIALSLTLQGVDLTLHRAQIDGVAVQLTAGGSRKGSAEDFTWKAAITDLASLSSRVSGHISGEGRLTGLDNALTVTASAQGEVATAGFPRSPVRLEARLQGLPDAPSGTIEASGMLMGSPVELAASARSGKADMISATIQRAHWKSLHAEGHVDIPVRGSAPQGHLALRIDRLEDLAALAGQSMQGSLTGNIDLAAGPPPAAKRGASAAERASSAAKGAPSAAERPSPAKGASSPAENASPVVVRIDAEARDFAFLDLEADRLTLSGYVENITTEPVAVLQLEAEPLRVSGIAAGTRIKAKGGLQALALELSSDVHDIGGADMHITASGTLDLNGERLLLSALQALYKGETAQLRGPAQVSWGNGVAVDGLRLGVEQAVLEVNGRISPALDLSASLRDFSLALARPFVPELQADGMLSARAHLVGSFEQPEGTVELDATDVRVRSGAAGAMPPATVKAILELAGRSGRLKASVAGAQTTLNASGTVPLSADGPIDLRVEGSADLAVANAVLEAKGQRVRGHLSLEGSVTGTLAQPRVQGTVTLVDGDLVGYAHGVHLANIAATLEGTGDTISIKSFTARAGPGTLSAEGAITLNAPGFPLALTLKSQNAEPVVSDLVTANLDMDLALRGDLTQQLHLAGRVTVNRAEINIPSRLPPEVAVLDVRRPGETEQPQGAPPLDVAFDVAISAPSAVFVRGRGVDAEMSGKLHVGGTSAAPEITGGFDLRRGRVDLAGGSLQFTSGRVSFTGSTVRNKIDPSLDFVSQKTVSGVTASLNITGYADAPKITLTSNPPMPQDEVLARLIFGTGITQLSPFQVAEIGVALISLTGAGPGIDPVGTLRQSLGLDRLTITGAGGQGTSVEAGRYVARRVYVGARQSTSGVSQGLLQVDLTRRLKLTAAIGNGTTTAQGVTPENDPGDSVGLTYQFEY